VVVQAECANSAVCSTKRLEAVEHGLRVVQHGGGRLESERLVGNDSGVVPPAFGLEVHHEDVIREVPAEAQRIFRGLGLEGRRFPDRDVERHVALPSGVPA
jgi:hypothetical protein